MTVHRAMSVCGLTPPIVVVFTSISAISNHCGGGGRGGNRVEVLATPFNVQLQGVLSAEHPSIASIPRHAKRARLFRFVYPPPRSSPFEYGRGLTTKLDSQDICGVSPAINNGRNGPLSLGTTSEPHGPNIQTPTRCTLSKTPLISPSTSCTIRRTTTQDVISELLHWYPPSGPIAANITFCLPSGSVLIGGMSRGGAAGLNLTLTGF